MLVELFESYDDARTCEGQIRDVPPEAQHYQNTRIRIASVQSDEKPLNPLNAELNPICHLLALLGVHHFLHVSRIRVNTRDRWMSSEFCNSLHIATMTRLGHQAPLFRRFRKRRRIVFLDSLCHISYVNDYAAVSALSFQH